jgi:hypothetical protein
VREWSRFFVKTTGSPPRRNINYNLSNEEVIEFLEEKFGKVRDLVRKEGENKPYAFVEFAGKRMNVERDACAAAADRNRRG